MFVVAMKSVCAKSCCCHAGPGFAPYLAQNHGCCHGERERLLSRLDKLVIFQHLLVKSSPPFWFFKNKVHIPLTTSVEAIMAMKCKVDIPNGCDFTLNNLPFGVFTVPPNETRRIGVAIGNHVLNLAAVKHLFEGPLMKDHQDVFDAPVLNEFMSLTHRHWSEARVTIFKILTDNSISMPGNSLIPMSSVQMHLPASIGDYTDFYSSIDHATNVGTMFRLVYIIVLLYVHYKHKH